MAKDQIKLEIVNEKNKDTDMHLDDEIEKIFGKPGSPKMVASNDYNNTFQNGTGKFTESEIEQPSQPLLEPNRNKQQPPLAGPEIDDLDGDPPKDATPYPGIDDGLLEPSDSKPTVFGSETGENDGDREPGDDRNVLRTNDDPVTTDGKVPWDHDEPDYPYGDWNKHNTHSLDHEEDIVRSRSSYVNGLGPRFGIDDRAVSPMPGVIPNVNTYQQKKNLAQGMMDLALLSANANQLRYVLESTNAHPYYYSSLTFISLSIIIQIIVGIGLILNSRYDVNDEKDICKADKINNMTVLGIFLITIVNVFITSFSVATPQIGNGFQQIPTLRGNST